MGKGVVKLGEGNWAVKDGNLLAAKETNGRFKNAEFTVTRGTDATYVGKDGLIKTASFYNLVTYSEDFSEWQVGVNTTITPNFAISPDGTQNATRLQTPTGSGTYLTLAASMTIGNDYTLTLYLKNNGGENVDIGVAASSTVGTKTASIEVNLTNEWVRYELNFTADSNSNFVFIDNINNANSVDCLIWGAQLEEGTEALDYQYTNGKEGIPRIDFTDNTDGHLLLEPESRNLITYSEDFSQWNENDATVTPNSTTSPSGLINADKVIASAINSTHHIGIIPSVSSSTTYTFSLYAKADEYERLYVRQGTGSSPSAAVYELSGSGSVLQTYGSPLDEDIDNVGNGWYRITLTNTTSASGANFAPNIIGIPNSGYSADEDGVTFLGDGTSGVFIWGAQLEELSYATSIIPTNGSTVTSDAE